MIHRFLGFGNSNNEQKSTCVLYYLKCGVSNGFKHDKKANNMSYT